MDSGPPPPAHLSPRREVHLQGPRPSPLRVSKDSHKIKKPPVHPPVHPPVPSSLESREPVIIYTVSPKVIHVEPSNFMDLVQRLTGPDAVSPAAKLAAIHRTIQSPRTDGPMGFSSATGADLLDEFDMGCWPPLDRPVFIPGILSPVPTNIPPISPAFFSPNYFDSSFQNFLRDLSPAGGGGGGNFWNSPGSFFSPSIVSSPGVAAWDIFNHFQDF